MSRKLKVGILGSGAVGNYLADAIHNNPAASKALELAFVWNRSEDRLKAFEVPLPENAKLTGNNLPAVISDWRAAGGEVDIIVEASHPGIIRNFGPKLLSIADLMIGSPGAFAHAETERALRIAAENTFGCYVPAGASWGVGDIVKMDILGKLTGLTVRMSFHPDSIRGLIEPLKSKLDEYVASRDQDDCLLYDGPVRDLCALAPNNVNTMACLSMAASTLGFDRVRGQLVTNKALTAHVVEIEVRGLDGFHVATRRYNPSAHGAVTGNATFASFLGSLLIAGRQGPGIHFC